jgi:hypothetical protein
MLGPGRRVGPRTPQQRTGASNSNEAANRLSVCSPSPPMSLPTPSQTAYVIQPYHDHRRHRFETPAGEAGARLDKVSSCFVASLSGTPSGVMPNKQSRQASLAAQCSKCLPSKRATKRASLWVALSAAWCPESKKDDDTVYEGVKDFRNLNT